MAISYDVQDFESVKCSSIYNYHMVKCRLPIVGLSATKVFKINMGTSLIKIMNIRVSCPDENAFYNLTLNEDSVDTIGQYSFLSAINILQHWGADNFNTFAKLVNTDNPRHMFISIDNSDITAITDIYLTVIYERLGKPVDSYLPVST